jgi:hypothetical protein
VCGGIFQRTVSDAEALAEMEKIFGQQAPDEELGIVCDDCWQAGMRRMGLSPN